MQNFISKDTFNMNHMNEKIFCILTVKPSMQTVKGRTRIYHPAQNPATGNAIKNKINNQTKLQAALPPAPDPEPDAILNLF